MAREHTGAWSASGQAELENRIVLLRVELEIYAGGGPRRGYYVYYVFYSYVVVRSYQNLEKQKVEKIVQSDFRWGYAALLAITMSVGIILNSVYLFGYMVCPGAMFQVHIVHVSGTYSIDHVSGI